MPGYKQKWHRTPKGKESNRNAYTKYRFGISRDEYERLLKASDGLCGICKRPMDMSKAGRHSGEGPVLDHGHEERKIREFTHRRCNAAIGLLKEDPVTCRLAAEYIEKHRR